MTQALQNQPFAKLKTVTRCTASYVRENEALKEENAYLKEERRHLEKSLEMFKGQSKGKENEELKRKLHFVGEICRGATQPTFTDILALRQQARWEFAQKIFKKLEEG